MDCRTALVDGKSLRVPGPAADKEIGGGECTGEAGTVSCEGSAVLPLAREGSCRRVRRTQNSGIGRHRGRAACGGHGGRAGLRDGGALPFMEARPGGPTCCLTRVVPAPGRKGAQAPLTACSSAGPWVA